MVTNKHNSSGLPALKTTDLLVLIVLMDGPQHGYGLAQEIDRRTKGRVQIRPGDLYRVLYRMSQDELIEAVAARTQSDQRRANYRITSYGRRVARENASMLTELCASVLPRQAKPEAAS